MNKLYILSFSVGVLVMVCVVLLGLVMLLPQQSTSVNVSLEEYEKISETDYRFQATKDVSMDNLVHEYSVSDTQISTFKKNYQYIAGNSDPFSTKSTSNNESNDTTTNSGSTTSGNTNNNSNTNSTNKNSNGNTVVVGK